MLIDSGYDSLLEMAEAIGYDDVAAILSKHYNSRAEGQSTTLSQVEEGGRDQLASSVAVSTPVPDGAPSASALPLSRGQMAGGRGSESKDGGHFGKGREGF